MMQVVIYFREALVHVDSSLSASYMSIRQFPDDIRHVYIYLTSSEIGIFRSLFAC